MTKKARLLLASVLLSVAGLVAGCGGATSSTVTSSPSPPAPSVRQVASVVAQQKASVQKLTDDLDKNCDHGSELADLACSFVVQRAPLVAQTLIKKLKEFQTVPAEIQLLVDRTVEDAQTLADTNVNACHKDPEDASCMGLRVAVHVQAEALLETLEGWAPYT